MIVYQTTIRACIFQLFIAPFLLAVFSSFQIVRFIVQLIRTIRSDAHRKKAEFFFRASALVCALAVLLISAQHLRYGIFLPFEREQQARTIVGTVLEVKSNPLSPRFSLKDSNGTVYDNSSFGCFITVEGKQLYCLARGENVAAGDHVIIQYLPRSRIILSYTIEPFGR